MSTEANDLAHQAAMQRQDELDASVGVEDGHESGQAERRAPDAASDEGRVEPQARETARMSPQDEAREAIANKFRRKEEVPFDGDLTNQENLYGDVARQEVDPDLDPNAPEPGVPAGEPIAAPEPRKITQKVRGVDVTKTEAEWLADAAKVTAADSYLQEGRDLLEQAKRIAAERDGRDPQHPEDRTSTRDDGQDIDPATGQPRRPGDDLEDLIGELQFGSDQEGIAKKLRAIIAKEAATGADQAQLQRLMALDLQKSQAALSAFQEANKGVLPDDRQTAMLIENEVYSIFREELVKAGINEDKLPRTPAEIADWHRFQRIHGTPGISEPGAVLNTAKDRFLAWRGVSTQPQASRPKVPGRVEVNLGPDRTERRAAIPVQPTRAVAPRRDAAAAPQQSTRSAAVMEMRKARGQSTG